MPWVNVFDVGPCEVRLYEPGPVLIPEGDYAARGIVVSTAGGVVAVSCDSQAMEGWEIRVVTGFDTAQAPVRVGAFATTGTPLDRVDLSGDWGPVGNESLAWDGDTYTPDPVTFASPGVWSRVIVSTQYEGAVGALSFVVEIEQASPPPAPDPVDCDEYGRSTRIYVSGYQRTRGHLARLTRGERRCLVVDFNGAIGLSRSIAAVTWRTNAPHVHNMSGARIVGRTAVVDLDARGSGCGHIKVEAMLDNGERCVQLVHVHVTGAPWFEGEGWPGEGVRTLTATA